MMTKLERRVGALGVGAENSLLLGLLEAGVPLGFVEGQVEFEQLSPAAIVRLMMPNCLYGFLLLLEQGMVQVYCELAHAC